MNLPHLEVGFLHQISFLIKTNNELSKEIERIEKTKPLNMEYQKCQYKGMISYNLRKIEELKKYQENWNEQQQ